MNSSSRNGTSIDKLKIKEKSKTIMLKLSSLSLSSGYCSGNSDKY